MNKLLLALSILILSACANSDNSPPTLTIESDKNIQSFTHCFMNKSNLELSETRRGTGIRLKRNTFGSDLVIDIQSLSSKTTQIKLWSFMSEKNISQIINSLLECK